MARFLGLLTTSLLLGACAHPIAPTKLDPSSPYAAVRVDNFAEVAPGIYRGGQPDLAGFQALKDAGIKTVVNLRTSGDEEAAAIGLDVVNLPTPSFPSISAPDEARLKAFFDVVTDPERQPVFIHCAHGCDRTGMMCAIYRIEVCGWTSDQAVEEMRSFGWHDWFYGNLDECVSCYTPRAAPKAAPTK
jgi:tyrosine-protein phosphatase SIW14